MVRNMTEQVHFRSGLLKTLPKSPYKILHEHFKIVCRAVQKLDEMMRLYIEGDFAGAASVSVEISKLEHEADELKQHLRSHLPRTFLMPISRADLLEILSSNERIADSCQDVAQILDMRRTKVPEEIQPDLERFVGHVVDSVTALRAMMDNLEHLLESAFAKIEVNEILEQGYRVHEHEYMADSAGKELVKAIYALEGKESFLAIYHMMRFTDVLDRVADNAENAANKMMLVVSK